MSGRLRIAVTGLAASFPLGGVFWDYVQYVLGFHRLGHEVLYVEDTGRWGYDPTAATFVEDGDAGARHLARHLHALAPELAHRWFYRDGAGRDHGMAWPEVVSFCREADLFLNLSASCWMRDEYFAARRTAFVDTDPMYTQARVPEWIAGTADPAAASRLDHLRRHDVVFTFAENVGREGCLIPTEGFAWIPTRQPIVLACFEGARVPPAERRPVLTTVLSWEPAEDGPVVGGVAYQGKSTELRRFMDLPRRSDLPLELAISGPAPRGALAAAGWRLQDPLEVSGDPWTYRGYLATSLGEWSVAKNAYVASRSGWFSCRTACYLALGVPAVVQDTGFAPELWQGEGLLPFTTPEEAAAAIRRLAEDPARHARAAVRLAAERFDARTVLPELLAAALG